jgi:hypothetical protein
MTSKGVRHRRKIGENAPSGAPEDQRNPQECRRSLHNEGIHPRHPNGKSFLKNIRELILSQLHPV